MNINLIPACLIALSILTTVFSSTALAGVGQIAAGASHAVALKGDGTVWCWGANSSGQLGNGLTTDNTAPVQVSGLTGVQAVAAGGSHSVALQSDGTVWTWGSNVSGQLGTGTYVSRATAGTVPGLTGVVVKAIAAGNSHTVVVKDDGTVWAWGNNAYGQLGNNSTTTSPTPVQVTGLTGITAVAAGLYHTVALQNDGTVWCWGRNHLGMLGDGSTTTRLVPVQVASIAGVKVTATAVAAGLYHTVALLTDGTVACWGSNAFGQLGTGTSTNSLVPLRVTGLGSQVTAIAAGGYNSVAVAEGGTVWTWGINDFGQLGTGTRSNSTTPVQAGGLTGVTMVAAGTGHTEALKTDGTVWVWGKNLNGQFGNGISSISTVPHSFDSPLWIARIAAGGSHSLALLGDGAINGWGGNSAGQLGNGTLTDSPVSLPAFGALTNTTLVTRLAAGDKHTIALTSDGQVWTSGANQYGQLGNGTTVSSPLPVQASITRVTAVAAGSNHSLALKSDGTVWAWGYNYSGQVGDTTQINRATPVQVNGLSSITAIAAGGDRSLALAADGSVWYWGRIDQNSVVGTLTPLKMSGLTGVVKAIAAGPFHTLALKSDGTVWAWGTNDFGELGSGTVGTASATPLKVNLLTGVTAIAAAGWHNLAVKSDGTVWSWGDNSYGQLGNGTLTSSVTPLAATGLTGVTAVAAGPNHSLALKGSGPIYTWGWNEYGQLGNGAVTTLPQQAAINLVSMAPTITDFAPKSVKIGTPATLNVTGTNLTGARLTMNSPGIYLRGLRGNATRFSIPVIPTSAALTVTNPGCFTVTTTYGSIGGCFDVVK